MQRVTRVTSLMDMGPDKDSSLADSSARSLGARCEQTDPCCFTNRWAFIEATTITP